MGTRQTVQAPVEIDESQAMAAAEVLKSIAHPLRLRILCVLSGQEQHVKGLAESLQVPSAIVSQQLRILRSAALVSASTRDGHAYYRIVEPHLFRMLNCVETCITARAARGER